MDKELIIRSFTNELSLEESETLNEWIEESVQNKKEYETFKKFWSNKLEVSTYPKQEIWQKVESGIDGNPSKNKFSLIFKYAASFTVLLTIGYLAYFKFIENNIPINTNEIQALEVVNKENPKGQKSIIKLPDGSTIYLNSNSKLSFAKQFIQDTREIELEGEAYFEVAKDSLHPFIVHVGGIDVVVKGTAFNVNAFDKTSKVSVTVEEGLVSINSPQENLLASKNEKVVFYKESSKLGYANFKDFDWAWKEGRLVFDHTSLSDVIIRLEAWYGVEIQRVGNFQFSDKIQGEYHNETLKNVLEGICYTTGLSFEMKGDQVKLFRDYN